jgi:hypothetical protein
MERPLVVTRVGGLVDTVRDGETGLVVNPSSPEDLARGILEMLRDPERARALGKAGRKLILERFTLGRTARDLSQLYQRLITRARKKHQYNPLISFWRLIAALPVFAYIAFRLLVIDMFIPIYLPIYLARLRLIPVRVYYRLRFYAYRGLQAGYVVRSYVYSVAVAVLGLSKRIKGSGGSGTKEFGRPDSK